MKFFQVLGNIFLVLLKVIGGIAKGLFCMGAVIGIGSLFGPKE